MKNGILFVLTIIAISGYSQDFLIKDESPLAYSGTSDGLRTVWFSSDNTMVYGDFGSISGWNIQSGKMILNKPMNHYVVHPSTVNKGRTLWVQGGSAYNNPEKKDITDMYNIIAVGNPTTGVVQTHAVDGFSIWNTDFIRETNELVAIISDSKTYTNSAVLFDLETKTIRRKIATGASSSDVMASIATSEDGQYLVIGYAGKKTRVEIYDLKESRFLKSFETDFEVVGLEVANGILAAGGGKKVILIDLGTLSIKKTISTVAAVFHLALSPNGRSVAVGSFSSGADLIDVESGAVNHFSDGLTNCLAFSQDGNMLAIGQYVTFRIPEVTAVEIWFNENPHQNTESSTPIVTPVNATSNYLYTSTTPSFKIEFPKEPEIKTSVNDKGLKSQALKCLADKEGFLVNVSELSSSNPKTDYKTSVKVASKFLTAMGDDVELLDEKKYTHDGSGANGTAYVFKKGKYTYNYWCIIIDGYLYQITYFTSDPESSMASAYIQSFKTGS